jgi:hypothetical protein
MEQRSCLRSAVKIPVLLDNIDTGDIRCASRDVGMGGMFLEASSPNLSKGEEVQMMFSLPTERGGRDYCLTAKVARIEKDGVGITFFNPDTATFRTIQELLRYSKSQNLH